MVKKEVVKGGAKMLAADIDVLGVGGYGCVVQRKNKGSGSGVSETGIGKPLKCDRQLKSIKPPSPSILKKFSTFEQVSKVFYDDDGWKSLESEYNELTLLHKEGIDPEYNWTLPVLSGCEAEIDLDESICRDKLQKGKQKVYHLVMPKVGSSLYKARRRLSCLELFKATKRMLQMILELQKKDIVHFDLKPENVLIDDNNKLYLIDFGLTKLVSPGAVNSFTVHFQASYPFWPPEMRLTDLIVGDELSGQKLKEKYLKVSGEKERFGVEKDEKDRKQSGYGLNMHYICDLVKKEWILAGLQDFYDEDDIDHSKLIKKTDELCKGADAYALGMSLLLLIGRRGVKSDTECWGESTQRCDFYEVEDPWDWLTCFAMLLVNPIYSNRLKADRAYRWLCHVEVNFTREARKLNRGSPMPLKGGGASKRKERGAGVVVKRTKAKMIDLIRR